MIFRPPPAASWPNACATFAACRKAKRFGKRGRGFIVRDLPWTRRRIARHIRRLNLRTGPSSPSAASRTKCRSATWAWMAASIPCSSAATPRKKQEGELALKERWYPIQVKQKDKVGRPDIDSFEAMMMREDCEKGFFVVVRLFVGCVAGDRILLQAQPQSHRRPDRAGNPRRADCEEAGVINFTVIAGGRINSPWPR